MDMECGLILSLLKTDRSEALRYFEDPVHERLFLNRGREYRYCMDYMRRFGAFPKPSLLQRRFPSFRVAEPIHPLGHYVKEMRDRFSFNRIVEVINGPIKAKLNAPDFSSIDEAKESLMALVMELQDFAAPANDSSWTDNGQSRLAKYLRVQRSRGILGIPTGWPGLDSLTHGLQKGHLTTVTGLVYTGKTWLLSILAERAWKHGAKVLFVTKEMPNYEIERRVDALHFGLPYERLRTGTLKGFQFRRYRRGLSSFNGDAKRHFVIVGDDDFSKGCGILGIIAKVKLYRPDILFIDGAHLLDDDRGTRGRVERFYNVSQDMKRMTKMLSIPVVQSVQQGKDAKGKEGGSLETMQWSFAWAQDADEVLDISGDRNAKFRTIKVLKQREGRTGEELIRFDLDEMCFDSGGIPPEALAKETTDDSSAI